MLTTNTTAAAVDAAASAFADIEGNNCVVAIEVEEL